MKGFLVRLGCVIVMASGAAGKGMPPLPKWTPEDFEKLQGGEIVVGEEFFAMPPEGAGGEQGGVEVLTAAPPEAAPEAAPDNGLPPPMGPPVPPELESEFPTLIEARFVKGYLEARPGSYMIDPQELLSRQEFRDRESFLRYHAGESRVDLYVMLFDAKQELPEELAIGKVFEERFAGGGPTALVYYHLGMPERAGIRLSEEVCAVASEEERIRALQTSVGEAFAKSDPADQLDSFLVEFSIRLYWIEKAMGAEETLVLALAGEAVPLEDAGRRAAQREGLAKPVRRALTVCLLAGVAVGLGWIGRLLAVRRARYHLPETDCPRLLGAPHAAGVGAVLCYRSAELPPSKQRDQVPDYLRRS